MKIDWTTPEGQARGRRMLDRRTPEGQAHERAFLRGMLGRVAKIAAVPPGNVDAFLKELGGPGHVSLLESQAAVDALRHERKLAVSELLKATERMIRAMERIQKYENRRRWFRKRVIPYSTLFCA